MKRLATRELLLNLVLLISSILVAGCVLELYFRYVHIQSNGLDVTLSSKKWLESYWKPVNSHGFRDSEYTKEYLQNKKLLFVVGDSFAGGYGIKDVNLRFSNITGRLLGEHFAALNIARRGWSTRDEVWALAEFPLTPDVLVLSYYVNDIEGVALWQHGVQSSIVRRIYEESGSPSLFHVIRRRSYLIDMIYWRLFPLTIESSRESWDWLQGFYHDRDIWNSHRQELELFVDYARYNRARMYVVLFPNLEDVRGSREILEKVESIFRKKGIGVLNLADLFMDVPSSRLVVNRTDAHPSEYVHRVVAEKLSELILNDQRALPGNR